MNFNTSIQPTAPKSNHWYKEMGDYLDSIRDYLKMKEKIFCDKFNKDYLEKHGSMPKTGKEIREYYADLNRKWVIAKEELNKMIYSKK